MPRLSKGNHKTGRNVLTYSRAPIVSCPGASDACKGVCYALKAYRFYTETKIQWDGNAKENGAPELPKPKRNGERTLLRIHVSGDFDTAEYIDSWIATLQERPDVTAWAYTKSWRVPELMPALERLRALPNMQLFASIDESMTETAPADWRIAAMGMPVGLACPEQTGKKSNCAECRYCFDGQRGNVNFAIH